MGLLSRLIRGRQDTAAVPDRETLDAWVRDAYDLQMQGNAQEAQRLFEKVLQHDPRDADALYFLGSLAVGEKRELEGVDFFQKAVEARPGDALIWFALAGSLYNLGRVEESIDAFQAGVRLHPEDVDMAASMWMAMMQCDREEEARVAVERARDEGRQSAQIDANLAKIYREHGRVEEAVAAYCRLLERVPGDSDNFSNLLFTLNYSDRHDAAALLAEHRNYAVRFARPYVAPPPERTWPRKLRIGYVSGDFRAHVVAMFVEPILECHDRARFETYCYYNHRTEDAFTARLRAAADHWRDCIHLTDAELADRIRADRIDILVDLSGHTGYNRLPVFGMKPAPVQATYLGYPGTTGLAAIDYRITDARADPPGEADRQGSERLVRLPDSFHCYRPRHDSPAVAASPAARKGYVTFGCFNNFPKLSSAFMDAAARVLDAVPGSRLWLKAKTLGIPYVADRVRARFANLGIDPGRVEVSGWKRTFGHHLEAYSEVDIALDSFPYNGTTTTCEALWMGVPVVVLEGDRHAARVGASLLHAVGLDEFIAGDLTGYVQTCVALAGDLPRLESLRAALRDRVKHSPLADERRFTANLERCYTEMWEARLRGEGAAQNLDGRAIEERLERAARLRKDGQLVQAGELYEQVLSSQPAHAAAMAGVWDIAFESGNPGAAVDWLNKGISAHGEAAAFHYMLGCSLQVQGKASDAISSFTRAVEIDPAYAKAHNNLGCALEAAGHMERSLQCYGRAVELDPGLAVSFYNRGNLYRQAGDFSRAMEGIGRALSLEPRHADWHCNLADLRFERMQLDEALSSYREALALEPAFARAHAGLGATLQALGHGTEAESSLREAIELDPGSAAMHSNLLLSLHYLHGEDRAALFAEHVAWARRHARIGWQAARSDEERQRRRRLRVGYVSPDFRSHSVAYFIEPVLAAHDRKALEIFCYASVSRPDEVTGRLHQLADHWRNIAPLTDQQAAERIRFDRIDILVDLAGHTAGGRPGLFARKPAPVQATWLGYPDTTGMAAVDYRITDALADPVGEGERFHVEQLVRLEPGFSCYQPPAESPEIGDAPSTQSGRISFGCFNHLWKITPTMVETWSRLLRALPSAVLKLKAFGLASPGARRELEARFVGCGVAPQSLIFLAPDESHAQHLARYNEIDVALDVFPYNGTTTTCEALWMGVPVVSLAGKAHLSRTGLSILSRAGLADLVTEGVEQYVAKAIAMANDVETRRELRRGLRQRLRGSPLLDSRGFTRSLEAAYQDMWAAYAEGSGPMRLHIGGKEKRAGWKILNIEPGPDVDYVGDCTDLSRFTDGSVDEVYASHVIEHLGYNDELPKALAEFHRVLKAGGMARISVPDFELLCRLFVDPSYERKLRYEIMRMVFGGQLDPHDFHRVGLTYEFLGDFLKSAGFASVERSSDFGLFVDKSLSVTEVGGVPISLNVIARK